MPLFWLSLAFLAGIGLADGLNWPGVAWWVLAGLSLGGGILVQVIRTPLGRRLPPFPYPLIPLLIFLGALRYQGIQPRLEPGFIAWYNQADREAVVEGWLVEPPDERDGYATLRVAAERISPADGEAPLPVHGLLLVRVPSGGGWRYGDRVRLQGSLESPPENETFSYREYLARQGVFSYMSRASPEKTGQGGGSLLLAWVYAAKERALGVVRRIFPDPEGALLAGILLGEDNGLPAPLRQAYNDTGTAHIIAISGFNISILSGLIAGLAGRLLGPARRSGGGDRHWRLYPARRGGALSRSCGLDGGPLALCPPGGAPPAGLEQPGLDGGGDVGLQPGPALGCELPALVHGHAGTGALCRTALQAFTTLASRRLPAATVQRLAGPVGEYFLFTLAAQATTLPVTVYHFQRLSLIGLLANPLVLPVQPAVMVLGGLAVLLGLLYLPLGQLVAYLAWPFVAYTNRVVALSAGLRWGHRAGQFSLLIVVLLYVIFFAPSLLAPP